MNQPENLRHTPLHAQHEEHGARMVPFAGWRMPVQYTGVLAEHQAVRERAGLFDVSHMGEFLVSGRGAEAFLHGLTPNNVLALVPGQAHYTALLTPAGTFVDDLLLYRLQADRFLLVVNAANTPGDLEWILSHAPEDVVIRDVSSSYALLALQGPCSAAVLGRVLGQDLSSMRPFRFHHVESQELPTVISRTGYTGEDGFEVYCPPGEAPELWRRILEEGAADGVVPAGLGARDTLRLEAALPLYGQDIDREHTPLEAGLQFIVKLDQGEFVGRDALLRQQEEGVSRRLRGFRLSGRGIARHGYPVSWAGQDAGVVTSGTHSPTLGHAIGMTYLPTGDSAPGTAFTVHIRGKEVEAVVVPLPFYRRPRS